MKNDLNLKLKGQRDYINGADLFNECEKIINKEGGWVHKIVFKKKTNKMCSLSTSKPDENSVIVAFGVWKDNSNKPYKFWVIEKSHEIDARINYSEQEIINGSHIDKNSISANINPNYTLMENAITLTKKLNNSLSQNIDIKWNVGQISLKQKKNTQGQKIKIITHSEKVKKFSRNKIFLDKIEIGEIIFATGDL